MPHPAGTATAAVAPQPLRRSWALRSPVENVVITRRSDLSVGANIRPAMPWEVEHWLSNPLNHPVLYDIYASLYGFRPVEGRSFRAGDVFAEVKAGLEEAFLTGRLLVVAEPPAWSIIADVEPAAAAGAVAATAAQKRAQKTWIEVQLVNKKGEPVKGARYRLKITDGSVREGTTDELGSVRVAGIDPGTCQISFPDFDAKEWMPG